ncbi:MAG TPA: glucose 1-dehydrogenase [Bacteroidales bacterium]|nr:glucose 1-dehydrogenase [Bacteroidales bacterium]
MKTAQNKSLMGQTAIVTGADSGIGKAIAIMLAGEGANVVVNYISDADEAQKVADASKNEGSEAIIVKADVSNEDQVKEMFTKTINTYGKLDILVNNAGIQNEVAIDEMSLKDWQKVIDVNLNGYFLCSREAIKIFKKQGVDKNISVAAGKIICISSVHERIPWKGHANYAASKGGVMLLMKSMAMEVASHKIRVNSIGPGAIKTPINKESWGELAQSIPYGRVGEPEDIAKAAVWLASDESDYVTGTTLFVDGGMTLYPYLASGN